MGHAKTPADARNHPAVGVVGGRIYVIGGRLAAANVGNMVASATDVVEEYDPATNTWSILPSMPIPRHGVAGAIIGRTLHLVSGMVTSAAVGAGGDQHLEIHTSSHDVLELPEQAPVTR